MLQYDMRYIKLYPEDKNMAKKQIPKWDWQKFLAGAKRPLIALIAAALVAWGVGDAGAALVAGLIVERGIATATWLINKK